MRLVTGHRWWQITGDGRGNVCGDSWEVGSEGKEVE